MYYLSRIIPIKNMPRERIYLYNRGDECIDITGGWVSNIGNITKTATHLNFTSAVDNGTRRISTVNSINFNTRDRLFVVLETTAILSSSYRMTIFSSTVNSGTTRFRNSLTGNQGINQTHFTPNVEKKVMHSHNIIVSDIISLVNNYGVWKVHEIYIEKYM